MTSPFSSLPAPAPDPIYAILQKARKAGPDAIDASIGMYQNDQGKVAVLPSVEKALTQYGASLASSDLSYPPLRGHPAFLESVCSLIAEKEHASEFAAIATTGGTGAVAINLRLLRKLHEDITVIVPVPTWANHLRLCKDSGVKIQEVPYFEDSQPSIQGILEALSTVKGPVGLLIQSGCHNPSGRDLSIEQWKELAPTLANRGCFTILDFAYQGFKQTPKEDTAPFQSLINEDVPLLICWSASKNHSMYAMRVGMACSYLKSEADRESVNGHYAAITRGMHSPAAINGQHVVSIVQNQLQSEWLQNLEQVRTVLAEKRGLLKANLSEEFHPSLNSFGMFALLPLAPQSIERLWEKNVFLTLDGRINIAGIPNTRIDEFCTKVLSVHE